MRLGIRLLSADSTLNKLSGISSVKVNRGETPTILFQLVDLDQHGTRYIPSDGATVTVLIPRYEEALAGGPMNTRVIKDYSINRPASPVFAKDESIWSLTPTAEEMATLISNSMRVSVNEGGNIKIATLLNAIQVTDWGLE